MWHQQYVGLRFKKYGRGENDIDCWGLILRVMREQKGIILPEYQYDYEGPNVRTRIRKASKIIDQEIERGGYVPVTDKFHQPFDLVSFLTGRLPLHVGIVIRHGKMLHIDVGIDACTEDYLGVMSPYSNIIAGVYRHVELC